MVTGESLIDPTDTAITIDGIESGEKCLTNLDLSNAFGQPPGCAIDAPVNSEATTNEGNKLLWPYRPNLQGNTLVQNLPGDDHPWLVTYIAHKNTQTEPVLDLLGLPWPPCIPVADYLNLPSVHKYLWQLSDENRATVLACLSNLNLIPTALHPLVSLNPIPLGLHKLRDLKKLLFEHAVMEPAVFGLARRADMALFLESTVLECIFSLCNAATRTWIAAKGSNAYYAESLSRSFVLSVYDKSENWSLGQYGVHPVSGENFGKCRIIIFHKFKTS